MRRRRATTRRNCALRARRRGSRYVVTSNHVSERRLEHRAGSPRLFLAVEKVGIDAESDLARGVAELTRDERDVRPTGDQEAGESVAEVVPPDRLEPGLLESGFQGSEANVRCVVGCPLLRREHVVVGSVESCLGLVLPERLREGGRE